MNMQEFIQSPRKVKEFLRWAWPCLKNLHLYSEEKQKRLAGYFKKKEKEIFEGIKTGKIDPTIIKTAWIKALTNVLKINSNHPMLDYMFGKHNEIVEKLNRFDPRIHICKADLGVYLGKGNVMLLNGETKRFDVPSYLNLKKGDPVGIHLNTIVDKLDKKTFEGLKKR